MARALSLKWPPIIARAAEILKGRRAVKSISIVTCEGYGARGEEKLEPVMKYWAERNTETGEVKAAIRPNYGTGAAGCPGAAAWS